MIVYLVLAQLLVTAPNDSISLEIEFDTTPPRMTKRFLLFGQQQLCVRVTLRNSSEKPITVEALVSCSTLRFVIDDIDGHPIDITRLTHVNPMVTPDYFRTIQARSSYSEVINVFSCIEFNPKSGHLYRIKAFYQELEKETDELVSNELFFKP